MEIKKMTGRYVRIAPEFITKEKQECVDHYYFSSTNQELIHDETHVRSGQTDSEWEEICSSCEGEPYTREVVYVNHNGAYFNNPYEVFEVIQEFYGIDILSHTNSKTFKINEHTLNEEGKHQLIIDRHGSTWSAEYFEVVKQVEEVITEHLPMGIIKEIKTISWVRDEEFYK